MKNIIKFITVSMLCMFLYYSCIDDFKVGNKAIDKPAGVDLTIDTVFSKRELARRFLWGLYQYAPNPVPMNEASGVLMTGNWYEALSDCVHSFLSWCAVNNTWYNGVYDQNGDGSAARWKFSQSYCYKGMRIGHIFLNNIDRVPENEMTQSEKDRMKAEAKIIIAGKHWELFRQYGGIPLGDREFSPSESNDQFPRATLEETYNYMIQLLDEAIAEPELKFKLEDHAIDNNPGEWFGRLTKASAYAQKMLVQLAAASPVYNNETPYFNDLSQPAVDQKLVWWGGFKQSLWDDLLKTCQDFIAANQAAGEPFKMLQAEPGNWPFNHIDNFRNAYWNRNTSELIYIAPDWPALGRPNYWNSLWSGATSGWGTQCPTAEFMEMFDNSDGTPFDTTGIYIHNLVVNIEKGDPDYYEVPASVKANPPRNIYEERDPRLYATIWVQKSGQRWRGGAAGQSEATGSTTRYEQWPGGEGQVNGDAAIVLKESYNTGLLIRKFLENHVRDEHMSRKYAYPILRMGGFHLIYAEALAETGNLAGAIDQINLVRTRVGLPNIRLSNGVRGRDLNTKEGVIKEILRERACELTYEDTRFNDMIRRKLVDDFKKPLHGVWTYRVDGIADAQGNNPYPELWYVKNDLTVKRVWWEEPNSPSQWSDKWYLCAFPLNEIQKGWGLIQNPGWGN